MSHESFIETEVAKLIKDIASQAMALEYPEAMEPFKDRVSPQMSHMIASVFESGVRIGVSRALIQLNDCILCIASVSDEAKK